MIMVKNLTPVIKYEKLKVQNHFYEMLTATVSHDLRTPLNSMIGLIANMDRFVDPDGKRFLGIIRNSSNFMLFLVNDLLDFFQIKNGKFRKNLSWINIGESLKDLMDMFRVGTNEKGLELFYEQSQSLPDELLVDS
jgi:signal transduction histidine kinase